MDCKRIDTWNIFFKINFDMSKQQSQTLDKVK